MKCCSLQTPAAHPLPGQSGCRSAVIWTDPLSSGWKRGQTGPQGKGSWLGYVMFFGMFHPVFVPQHAHLPDDVRIPGNQFRKLFTGEFRTDPAKLHLMRPGTCMHLTSARLRPFRDTTIRSDAARASPVRLFRTFRAAFATCGKR